MGTIRVENRSHGSGDALIGFAIAAVLLMLLLWPIAILATRPSAAEVRRAEQAARHQAQLDDSWRPWTTAAKNLAIISGCLGVPTTIVVVSFVVIRRTRVMWPIEEPGIHVRTQPAGKADSAVLVGVPTRPGPQGADAA